MLLFVISHPLPGAARQLGEGCEAVGPDSETACVGRMIGVELAPVNGRSHVGRGAFRAPRKLEEGMLWRLEEKEV